MIDRRYFHANGVEPIPAILILVSSAVAIAVSLHSLSSGYYVVFQNFFYFPIILACFFYARRGFVFAVALSCLYVVLLLSFTQDPEHLLGAIVRFILFVLVAAVIAALSADQQRIKTALAESERSLNDIINFLPDATFVLDLDGRIVIWNHAMEQLTGARSEEVVGRGDYEHAYRLLGKRRPLLADIVLQDDPEQIRRWYPDVRNVNGVLSGDLEIEDLHGKKAVVWAVATPLRNNQGEIIGAIESIRDVTLLHDTRVQLQQANESLTLANTKLHLIGKMTQHDLLNTTQALSGYIELIRQATAGDRPLAEYTDGADALVRTLCEQVEFARDYQSVGIKEPVWQDLQYTVANGLATVTSKGVAITAAIDPVEVYADPLLERVIYNLATNAIIHGQTVTEIRFSTERAGSDMLLVCEDDGIGVPEPFKSAIFRREHYSHSGYGLFLACEILAITGLSIREAGIPGKGSRFEIRIPAGLYRSIPDREQQNEC
jgi:PAS domain S-box-containing protein